uniref:OmpA family protein n=1 Tax=Fulvivirga sp. TaxID=1931237 RepID=UPI00404A12AE
MLKRDWLHENTHGIARRSSKLLVPDLREGREPISSGAETVLKNIFFQSNEFQLEEKSFVELENVVQFLTVNPTIRVEISGHTDNTGTAKANLELSNKRAQSVVDFLVMSGISKARITYLGFGDKKPIGTNDTEEGKALNRRIAFKIL